MGIHTVSGFIRPRNFRLGEPEQHVEKLKALEEAGVTQFNIYLMNSEEERIVAEYGDKIIPKFR